MLDVACAFPSVRDKDHDAAILGSCSRWSASRVDLDATLMQVSVPIEAVADGTITCPTCDQSVPGHDSRDEPDRPRPTES